MSNNNIIFRLHTIATEQFAIIEKDNIDETDIELEASIDFMIHPEQKLVGCIGRFQFIQEVPFMIIHVRCEYKIQDSTWDTFINNGQLIFPEGFTKHLAILTVGTSRGILHAKTENSSYNKFFLPILNANELVTENIVFDLAL